MAQFLSDEWFSEMRTAAEGYEGVEGKSIIIREVITETPAGKVVYLSNYSADGLVITQGPGQADISFTQTYETAVALHRNELTMKEAFFNGRVKAAGHLNLLQENAEALAPATELFADVRATTTY